MWSQRQKKSSTQIFIASVDARGRTIEPAVLSAANEIGPRAVAWAEKHIGDQALAVDLFEETAATVSEAIRDKALADEPGVRDLGGYLFTAYMRRVRREERTEPALGVSLEAWSESDTPHFDQRDAENHILIDQLLSHCDHLTRAIILLRSRGLSYKDIEKAFGISAVAARQRYSTAIRQIREALRSKERPT